MTDISDKFAKSALDVIIAYCGQFGNTCEGCMFDSDMHSGCVLQDGVVPENLEKYWLTGEEE